MSGPGTALPREALAAVAGDVVERLQALLPEVLALPRFAAAVEALGRLDDPAWRAAGAAACTDGEAARLGAVLEARWVALAALVPPEPDAGPTGTPGRRP